MSQINVNNIRAKDGVSAVGFPGGINATGVVTATSFSGNLTGNVTGNADTATSATSATTATTAGALGSGATGADLTLSGNLTVNGTTTTIDTAVTAVDSLEVDGNVNVGAGLSSYGFKIENGFISNLGASGTVNTDLSNGHIHKYQGATSGNYGPNFRVSASKTLNSVMGVGDITSVVFIVASSSHYLDQTDIQVDGSTSNLDIDFVGGSAPTAANGSGFDIYSFTIQKTAATPAYHIIVNASSAA